MDSWEIAATILMISAVGLSFYEIIKHMCNFNKPYLQRYIIRILLIVPIYSLNAWMAMILPKAGLYLDSLREVYESFVIYSFMRYLLNFLQYDTNLQQYIDHKPAPGHIFPLCFLPSCTDGRAFMLGCKHGILQYVVIRPITTLIAFISQMFGFYGEQNYNPLSGYTYPVLLIVNNLSQFTAMYSLVIFYKGYRQELHPMQPLTKFFSIKLVVFFSFFQSVLISGLMEIDLVEETVMDWFPELDDKILAGRKLQEMLICIDMLIAGLGHLYAFSYKPFTEDSSTSLNQSEYLIRSTRFEDSSCCRALRNIFDFDDEKSDVMDYLTQLGGKVKQFFTLRPALPSVVSTNSIQPQQQKEKLPVLSRAYEINNTTNLDHNLTSRQSQLNGSTILVTGNGVTSNAYNNNNYQSIE